MIIAGALLLVLHGPSLTYGQDNQSPYIRQRIDPKLAPSDPIALLVTPTATPNIVIDPIKQKENAVKEKPKPKPIKKKAVHNVAATPAPQAIKSVAASEVKNPSWFAFGNCTRYAATRFPVTWSGDAREWTGNARAQGYTVDKVPEAGALLVTAESKYGHVLYIESVTGEMMYVTEMNFGKDNKNKVTDRHISIHNKVIRGVIHRK